MQIKHGDHRHQNVGSMCPPVSRAQTAFCATVGQWWGYVGRNVPSTLCRRYSNFLERYWKRNPATNTNRAVPLTESDVSARWL